MAIFEPVRFEWQGRQYVIPPDRVMRAIAMVENHITINELGAATSGGNIKFTKIADAYAAVLNYAASLHEEMRQLPPVQPEEVYDSLFSTDEAQRISKTSAVTGLLMLMVPTSVRERAAVEAAAALKKDNDEDAPRGNRNRRARRATGANSSDPSTKPRLAAVS